METPKQEKKGMLEWLFNKIKRDELKAGDHIYSWRHNYLYAHHGIYVGLAAMTTRIPGLAAMITCFPGLAAMATGFSGQAVFCYCISRLHSEIGIRTDMTKVPVESLFSSSGLDESNPTSATRTTNASETTKKD